ncbi:S-layer protein [Stratiformator vulcanicus]|uniref:Beta-propeller repeat protein n=1 Tax=Stratiformator vulcanicus TaxID=2527980 RepID=A0A517R2X0_9PLAN|nr:S-layer protein [Stratiformator vulcanicus]QDT38201.1 Beta-propeller repeat protein [Stratiformator vulcanicus]
MRKRHCLIPIDCFVGLVSLAALGLSSASAEPADPFVFSTYYGGSNWDHARDVCADADGNVYIVGGTSSPDFPTTAGVVDRVFNQGGEFVGAHGDCDVLVVKFSADGRLLWSTFIGGPNYDRAYGVEVGPDGFIYVAGRAGPGFPTTKDVFQPDFSGSREIGFYGAQNAFVLKLRPDGTEIVWATYVGVGELCRDVAVDTDGSIFVPMSYTPNIDSFPDWMDRALQNSFQKKPAGDIDCGLVKIRNDGSAVSWASWLGGSGKDTQAACVRLDGHHRPVVSTNTTSSDMPTTDGAESRRLNGVADGFVAMFKADGSELVYGTYLGGSDRDWSVSTHQLEVDDDGHAYLSMGTMSADFPIRSGSTHKMLQGISDVAVVKLSTAGKILQNTLIGGSANDGADGIAVDEDGTVYFVGETGSRDFPVTENAFQKKHGGGKRGDGFVVKLSSDFETILYASYLGGPNDDNARSASLGPDGALLLTGAVNGPGWPTRNASQPKFAGTDNGRWANGDCIAAKLRLP